MWIQEKDTERRLPGETWTSRGSRCGWECWEEDELGQEEDSNLLPKEEADRDFSEMLHLLAIHTGYVVPIFGHNEEEGEVPIVWNLVML